jgi:ribosomal 50S subunit-recycling heat shock protein
MRLDLYLKISRLVARRSLAQELCEAGLITVNGSQAKSGKDVKAGDEIGIRRRNRFTRIRINAVPASKQVSKTSAGGLFAILEDNILDDESALI